MVANFSKLDITYNIELVTFCMHSFRQRIFGNLEQ